MVSFRFGTVTATVKQARSFLSLRELSDTGRGKGFLQPYHVYPRKFKPLTSEYQQRNRIVILVFILIIIGGQAISHKKYPALLSQYPPAQTLIPLQFLIFSYGVSPSQTIPCQSKRTERRYSLIHVYSCFLASNLKPGSWLKQPGADGGLPS